MKGVMRKIIIIMAVVLLSGILLAGCATGNRNPQAVMRAPDFTLNTLQGQSVSLGSLRGHGLFINFWKSS